MDDKKTLIEVSGLTQAFKVNNEVVKPIKNVNLEIKENSFNIVFGPSGSGKSTLLNAISGLQKPSEGTVIFQDRDIYKLSPNELARFRANHIGIVYQDNYWVKSLSILENICMPLYFLGYSRHDAHKMGLLALERVSMASYAKKPPYVLSLGEQQRAAMARAVVTNPLFLIADEPTGNLDRKNGDFIMELLERCKIEYHCTVVLVTHNLEYLPIADRLFHMEDGTVRQIKASDVDAATNELMDDIKTRIERYKQRSHRAA